MFDEKDARRPRFDPLADHPLTHILAYSKATRGLDAPRMTSFEAYLVDGSDG